MLGLAVCHTLDLAFYYDNIFKLSVFQLCYGPVVKPGIMRPWLFIPNWVRLREIVSESLWFGNSNIPKGDRKSLRIWESRPVHSISTPIIKLNN